MLAFVLARGRKLLETTLLIWVAIYLSDWLERHLTIFAYSVDPVPRVMLMALIYPLILLAIFIGPLWYFRNHKTSALDGCVAGILCMLGLSLLFFIELIIPNIPLFDGAHEGALADLYVWLIIVSAFVVYGYISARFSQVSELRFAVTTVAAYPARPDNGTSAAGGALPPVRSGCFACDPPLETSLMLAAAPSSAPRHPS